MSTIEPENDFMLDQHHIWHPYAPLNGQYTSYHVTSTQGVHLHLNNGQVLIDGMASWWCAIHGYNHPRLNQAITQQIKTLSHVMFGGLTHTPAIELAKKLIHLTPEGLNQVFFADSGSVAIEVAIKMAVQYWQAKQQPNRTKLLTIRKGYHGDTFGAMSVCDPETGMHHQFNDLLMKNIHVDGPTSGFDATDVAHELRPLEQALHHHADELMGIILEPIVQGAGGMNFYSPHYLKGAHELAKSAGILFIADEIATGFGRTGKLFACEHAKITPDILCLGKALTGGYMTLAATLCTQNISHTISEKGALMHGPTFMGNPLACRVASDSIDLLLESHWEQNIRNIEARMLKKLTMCQNKPYVRSVRILGAIGVVELTRPVNMNTIQPYFVSKNVWIRPFGCLIYLMPPYTIEMKALDILCSAVYDAVNEIERLLL
ncbi:MAG: adenosylmethionine--8-amino-7-oxononanoate transaminase [Endozoicomonadaceae bacterium]|nr:adenosylmethionine--8-amino-7-oxononanoate transaminase [Endozoicomonadaceae bacterium]